MGDPCVRCGKPSTDHHHGRPDNLNMGKGMGGTRHEDHYVLLDLCRDCHDRAHAKTTIFTLSDDGTEVTWRDDPGKLESVGGVREIKLRLDQTDEFLASKWGEAQQKGEVAVIEQAEVALVFRRKYGGFDRWWVRVADIIREVTGLSVSVGTVYDRASLGMALSVWEGDPLDFVANFGVKSAATIGRVIASGADAQDVFEKALALRDEKTRTQTAQAIKQEFFNTSIPDACVAHVCKTCGHAWT